MEIIRAFYSFTFLRLCSQEMQNQAKNTLNQQAFDAWKIQKVASKPTFTLKRVRETHRCSHFGKY